MKETVLLIRVYGLVFIACATACNHGWFGSRCQYKCHCLNNETCEKNNGTCQSGCEKGWFGPECQYSDLAATKVTGDTTDFKILLDNNDKTCFNDSSPTKVNIILDDEYVFTWLRIHVNITDILYNFEVTFGKENEADNIECNNERRSAVSDTILDIHCQLNVTIKHLILEGEAVKSFCSIRISGGRNIALHENAQQSSNYTDTKTYSADLAVDGNTNGDFTNGKTCTHTAEFIDPSPWWSLTFQNPPRLVTRYILYNRADFAERLKAFNLTSFGNDTSVVFNHIDKIPTNQSVYTVIQEPWLKPVSYLVIRPNIGQQILTLCEVEVYGDSLCAEGQYGRECEDKCNCEINETCFVSTGGCPSGCAAGFWGEGCHTDCPKGWFGSQCKYKCHCLNNETCDKINGTCQNGCAKEWFGPACQYMDLAVINNPGSTSSPQAILTNNNDRSCIIDASLNATNISLDKAYPFTWLRIILNNPDLLDKINVTFSNGSGAPILNCEKQRKAAVSNISMDIYCDLGQTVSQVILEGEGVKALCSVHISGGRNIALKENAQQSSYYTNTTSGKIYSADLAVDGNTNGYFTQGQTCTHTASGDTSPWWSLTFQKPPRLVTRYVLYNRIDNTCDLSCMDRLRGFLLTSFRDNTVVFNYTDPQQIQPIYTVMQANGQDPVSYLKIYLREKQILTLCEVEVYGDSLCAEGQYGRECEDKCNCEINETCFASTGGCPSGCAAGFWGESCYTVCPSMKYGVNCKQNCSINCTGQICNSKNGHCDGCTVGNIGDFCEKPCSIDTYGQDCKGNCSKTCAGGVRCDITDGTCPSGCLPGYTNEYCNKICSSGTHGQDCKYNCSNHCANNKTCNFINGTCSKGCMPGYSNPYCNETCPKSTYGEECQNKCSNNCVGGETCDHVNGTCPNGCLPGYINQYCTQGCPNNTYGVNCSSNCSINCVDNGTHPICNIADGTCLQGCEVGYKGPKCDEKCPDGTYGQDCKNSCSNNCADNKTCNFISGTCSKGCMPGYINDYCNEKCPDDTYGQDCKNSCSNNCADNKTCNFISGTCSKGCMPGYINDYCNESCPNNTYGANCSLPCSVNCANDGTRLICHSANGSCLHGCADGYMGSSCGTRVDNSDEQTGLIVGLIVAVLILVAIGIIGGVIFKRRRKLQKPKTNSSLLSGKDKAESSFVDPVQLGTGSPVPKPSGRRPKPQVQKKITESDANPYYNVLLQKSTSVIPVKELNAFLSSNGTDFLREQFEKAPSLIGELSMEDGLSEENRHKNRYKNICAYDHSRVHLIKNNERHEGDYINASYIESYKNEGEFIASQGPNKIMIDDFIRMLWEQKPDKVVMLTNLIEEGKVKCDQYWPDDEPISFGEIIIEQATTHVFADYTIRKLKLTKSGKASHSLTHFHFTSWPDKGVPSAPWALVDFEQRVAAIVTNRPTVVHCSAGVGRTGTFIALCNIVKQAENTGSMDFFTTLLKLRKDRINLIQTLEQYIFLHKAAHVAMICKDTTVTASNIARRLDFLQKTSESGKTNMQMEFEAICNVCAENNESTYKDVNSDDAKNIYENNQTASNKHKNRVSNIVPRDQYRPHLVCNLKDSGDYINAVIVPSFTKQDSQLLTQLPLPTTIVDLWRLVTQYNVSLIVAYEVDTKATDPTVVDYLPTSEDESITCGPFDIATGPKTVTSIWEEQKLFVSSNKDRADKLMSSTTAAVKHTVTHLTCTSTDLSPKTLLSVVGQIQSRRSKDGRTLYMCRNGATYSGIVCVISLLLDRIENDQHLTVPLVLGTIKCIRPQVIPDLDQYQVLYEVLKWYNETSNVYSNFGEANSGNALSVPEASENVTDEEEAADNDITTYSNMKQ